MNLPPGWFARLKSSEIGRFPERGFGKSVLGSVSAVFTLPVAGWHIF